MLEVTLFEPDDFLKVKETLTRIGAASETSNTLFQSCHILHKQGRYFIVHFKELFLLDGKRANLTQNDLERRNTIATLLADWGLVTLYRGYPDPTERAPLRQIKIIKHSQKDQWELKAKYTIGKPQDKD
jgi:hypothetical protein